MTNAIRKPANKLRGFLIVSDFQNSNIWFGLVPIRVLLISKSRSEIYFFGEGPTDDLQADREFVRKAAGERDRRQTGQVDRNRGNIREIHRERVGRFFAELRSEEHTSELQSQFHLVCRLLLYKK